MHGNINSIRFSLMFLGVLAHVTLVKATELRHFANKDDNLIFIIYCSYIVLSHLNNIHEQIKQRHWCKQRHVPCARMRCSSTQVFRLAECYVPR